MTIAETIADVRRDTGLLIAGLREYSSLSVAQRDAMRRGRMIVAAAAFVAGAAPVPVLVVMAWTVPLGESTAKLAVLTAVALTLGLLTFALALRWRERKRLRPARDRIARRRTAEAVPGVLVETWQISFD